MVLTMTDATTNIYLSRREASAFLKGIGIDCSPASLATMASRGNGPFYRTFGRRAVYRREDLVVWVESRLSTPRRSTAEADVHSRPQDLV